MVILPGLTSEYFAECKRLVLGGIVVGTIAVGVSAFTGHRAEFPLIWLAITPFLASPFTLRTAVGRWWWSAYAVLYACLLTVHLLGLHHLLGWLAAIICVPASTFAVCLRWNPPAQPEATGQ